MLHVAFGHRSRVRVHDWLTGRSNAFDTCLSSSRADSSAQRTECALRPVLLPPLVAVGRQRDEGMAEAGSSRARAGEESGFWRMTARKAQERAELSYAHGQKSSCLFPASPRTSMRQPLSRCR